MFHFQQSVAGQSARRVFIGELDELDAWPQLLQDTDWLAAVDDPGVAFTLMVLNFTRQWLSDGASAFVSYCLDRRLLAVVGVGPGSTVFEDEFHEEMVAREVLTGAPSADPLTAWLDEDSLEDALEFFVSLPAYDPPDSSNEVDCNWVILVVADAVTPADIVQILPRLTC